MADEIKIRGAGISGLSAAINLARAGKEVIVYELRNDVGKRFSPSGQIILRGNDYIKSLLEKSDI